MAQRLPREFFAILAAIFLLLVAERSDAQSLFPIQQSRAAPKPAESPPAAKELSKEKIESLIEQAFGKDCAELKRPIRVWIPDFGMVMVAEKATVARDGRSVRFASFGIGFSNETTIFRGNEATVAVENPVTNWSDLTARAVKGVEMDAENVVIALTPAPQPSDVNARLAPPNRPAGDTSGIMSRPIQIHFKFNIDPKAPLGTLLPRPMKTMVKAPSWANEDLAKVPELAFGEPISKTLAKQKAMEQMAHVVAKVNHLNLKKTDGFLLAMLDQRPDLRGLPFLMGDDCRMRGGQAAFALAADSIRRLQGSVHAGGADREARERFWSQVNSHSFENSLAEEHRYSSLVAALTQILMPESGHFQVGLAKYLTTIPDLDATKALAKLAIFSSDEDARDAAIEGLKRRSKKDYTDILMLGFRYPLPAVSKRAAEALVVLDRKDLLANLVEVLESPDPRLPVSETRDGKDVTFVRELVKVNHHKNCLLCHAPGNTDDTPQVVLKVAMPLPGEPLPEPSEGGYQGAPLPSTPPAAPDIVVRLDMTYLRQDFSVMMPVSEAHPWPEMQRFDFLVRTRTLTSAEAQGYVEADESGRLSPYHRSALFALRELTGRDTEPTAAAWRKLLKLPPR